MYFATLAVIIVLFLIAIIEAFTKKDFMHPLVMYSGPIFLQYSIFFVFFSEDSSVSSATIVLYTLSIVCYATGYLITETIVYRIVSKKEFRRLPLDTYNYPVYKFITIIGVISILYEILRYGVGSEAANLYDAMAIHIDWGGGYNFLAKYIPFFYGVVFAFFVYNYDYDNKNRMERKRFVWAVIMAYAFAIASFSRTSIMQQTIVLVYIVMYRNRKKIFRNVGKIVGILNKAFIGIVILLIGFSIIAKLTSKFGSGSVFSKDFYLWSYLSAQIQTLDKYIIAHPGASDFYYIGGVFSRLLGKSEAFRMYLPVLSEFNVFSYIGAIYLDCGSFAYVIQIVLGSFVAYLYCMNMKKGGYWTVYYAFYSFAIFMSFYAYQYSLTTYIYLLIAFFVIKVIHMMKGRSR